MGFASNEAERLKATDEMSIRLIRNVFYSRAAVYLLDIEPDDGKERRVMRERTEWKAILVYGEPRRFVCVMVHLHGIYERVRK